MEKPKRIMAACDDSTQAAYVAAYAASLACIMAARVILARVIPICDIAAVRRALTHFLDGTKDPDEAISEYIIEEKKNSHKELGLLLSHRYRGLKIETVVRVGVPYEVLLDLVTERMIDMVVVGASKHNILLDRIMGSTVSHLLSRCPVPLVSARQTVDLVLDHRFDSGIPKVYTLNQTLTCQAMDCAFTSLHER